MIPVFFIGSHRIGSKTIAHFFRSNFPAVISHHQFTTLRFVNVFSNMYLTNLVSEHVFEKFVRTFVVNRIKKQSCSFYIEANGFNLLAAYYAKKLLAGTKIIHIIRDPRDFVTSYFNWTHGRWQSQLARYYMPFWDVNGYRVGEMPKDEWLLMDEFEGYCWTWKFKNQKILDLYSADHANFMTVRFEDIVGKNTRRQTIKDILNFIGLNYTEKCEEYFDRKQNESRTFIFPDWHDWDRQKCKVLNKHCGDLMKKFGYGTEEQWQIHLKEREWVNKTS